MAPQTDSTGAGSADLPRPAVVYFAKVPRPGRVKTRLVPPLTEAEAAALYGAFLRDLVVPVPGARTLVYGWPAGDLDQLRGFLPAGMELRPQHGDDLFERMSHCMEELFAEGHQPVLIRNTDSPDLPMARVQQALQRCRSDSVVLGPDKGGGYYLVALSAACPELFADARGRDPQAVFTHTVERARALGLGVDSLAHEPDVDTFDDLVRMWNDRM